MSAAAGETLGTSSWLEVSQDMIDRFADVTGDHQWIHVDAARARHSPYGRTVAHGWLTVALMPRLRDEIFAVEGVRASINYGCERLRFIEPVPSGSRIRLGLKLLRTEPARQGVRVTLEASIEREGAERPVLVAELILLLLPA
ncbi:MAG TPA: MaoC family dehydratase [Stellaceae bacterium]|nr:MaoC family dehydratase [Stellaceae bacterium]